MGRLALGRTGNGRDDFGRGPPLPEERSSSLEPPPTVTNSSRLREVAFLFLRLGCTSFGGPAAHVALMEAEVVTRRKWVTREEFLDLFAATNLIPGPNSTEMAIHLGYRRAGVPGLIAAGACFIGPAALITAGFAVAYVHLRTLPALSSILYGIRPAILSIVLAAIARLVVPKKKDWFFLIVGGLAAIATVAGANEILVLLAGVALGFFRAYAQRSREREEEKPSAPKSSSNILFPFALGSSAAFGATSKLGALTLFFLKVGSILYGSGYVLIALLRAGLVTERGWLKENELLDAVAIGQFTPGPVLSTATFIGYLIEGPLGAIAATLAIFLPSFLFVWASAPYIPKLRASKLFSGLLDGASAASLGLLVAATMVLARGALVDIPAVLILALALPIALQPKINATWVVVGGAVAGIVTQRLGVAP